MAVLVESNTIPIDNALVAEEIAVRSLMGSDCRGAAQGSLETNLKRDRCSGGEPMCVFARDVSRTWHSLTNSSVASLLCSRCLYVSNGIGQYAVTGTLSR